MQLIRGLHHPECKETGCVATIGNFDGVHLGHQAIIQRVIAKSKEMGLPSMAMIFEPQPMEFFKGDEAPARLMRFREKFEALRAFDLDCVLCLNFNHRLRSHSAEAFIDRVLLDQINLKHLVIGDDFRFGGDRAGDYALLVEQGKLKGFSVENTPTHYGEHSQSEPNQRQRVSSTLIRQALANSEFELAHALLGREYQISGRVIHGEKLGRTIGFPTANIALHRKRSPLAGVYAVRLTIKHGETYAGVANIGVKPTVGNFKPSLEVHLFDFKENIYGEAVSVTFHHKVRDEMRFNGVDALKAQIEKDIEVAKSFFATQN